MFYIITALSAAVVVIGAFVLQKGGDTNRTSRSTFPPSCCRRSASAASLYGLSTIGSYGLRVDAIAGTLVGVVALVFFFRRQLKMEKPMLQVRVLQNRKFLVATVIGMLVQGALLAAGILVPIYLQSLMGYSATVSGLVLLPALSSWAPWAPSPAACSTSTGRACWRSWAWACSRSPRSASASWGRTWASSR